MFTPEYITTLIKSREYDTLAIFDASERNQIDFASGDTNNLLEAFETFYTGCEVGSYKIHLYVDGKQDGAGARKDSTRRRKIPFRKTGDGTKTIESGNDRYFERIMELQRENMQLQFDMKLETLRQETSSQGVAMLQQILQFLPSKSPPAGVAGAPVREMNNDSSSATATDHQKELAQNLAQWQSIDENFDEKIKAIVRLAKEKPAVYEMALKHLEGNE